MSKPVLAAQLYTVREFTKTLDDFAASMKKIKDIGYTAVQVSAIGPIADEDVRKVTDDLGLTICNTHVRPSEALWNDLDSVMKQHDVWGTKHVAIGSMPGEYQNDGEDGYKRFAAEANQIGEKLHAAGFTFSYHNHNFEFVRFGDRTGMDIIYGETDPRFLQAEIDTYWVQAGGGDPAVWIKRMKDRMPVIHLKDMVIVGREQRFAEVGAGNMNFEAILAACKEANVEWYAIEQDNAYGRDPFECLKVSYDNLVAMGLS